MVSESRTPGKAEPARPLDRLRDVWRKRLRSSLLWCKFWASLLAVLVIAQLARAGTVHMRTLSVLLLLALVVGLVLLAVREKRAWKSPRHVVKKTVFSIDRALGERILRAVGLLEHAHERPDESSELSRAHFERLLRRVSPEAVERMAASRARKLRLLWLLGAALVVAILLGAPLRVVEGLNVLVARGGTAPLELPYLDDPYVSAELPAYLKGASRSQLLDFGVPALPEGSVITLRSRTFADGRKLVVTDGVTDVPLVSDGQGGLVAHWTLAGPTELRVAAQLGDVKVFDPFRRAIASVEDREPIVVLTDAPGTVELLGMDRLELRFVASDDYGLEQVDLVLRSGRREERRQLAKLNGAQRLYRSGHALLQNDPFLRRMFLPVSVSIEAKDNRPGGTAQWGRSPAIVIRPPPVGRPEAERYQALRVVRDRLVDLVALDQTKASAEGRMAALAQVKAALELSVNERPGGLAVPPGAVGFVNAQLEALRRGDKKAMTSDSVLLAIDVMLGRLSTDGARAVAPRLGDVAEELAVSAHGARSAAEKDPGNVRAMLEYARRGALELSRLGPLGRDLGSVAIADLGRVQRALDAGDLRHVELAAMHLAARLRRPNPSFGTAGGKGGVESGMPSGGQASGSGNASPSEAPNDFDQLAGELDELASDHAQQMSELDRLLNEAQAAGSESKPQDARARAEELRDALSPLPSVGTDPGSAWAAAARGRGHGESMADGIESGDLKQAVENGRAALDALDEAERLRSSGLGWLDADELAHARDVVRRELEAAQNRRALEKEAQKGELRERLRQQADREEHMSERARELSGKGRSGDAPLPGEATKGLDEAAELMREAAGEMRQGNADKALELQRKAQDALEKARTGRTDQPADDGESGEGREGADDRGEMARDGEVPGARERDATQEFRERLQRGLGRPSGKLGPAVRRYAEALE